MNPTRALHETAQSLWLDNITRALLDEGTLGRYIAGYSVTGSPPTPPSSTGRSRTAPPTTPTSPPAWPAEPRTRRCFLGIGHRDLRGAAAAAVRAGRTVLTPGPPGHLVRPRAGPAGR